MNIGKYLNKNKIGAVILIIVIIIAFGFGGFGGGFLSNNQNNIAKIDKTNITTQDLINYINQNGISEKVIKDNLDKNIIEELLSSLISSTLLNLEVEDFNIKISQNSLSKKIQNNKNFFDENDLFQRTKYEMFLLENNITAPLFERKLKEREMQKKLFDFIGAGTVSPEFLISKLFENENKKLMLEFIDLAKFYKKKDEFSNEDLNEFLEENSNQLKVEYIDFKYSVINPLELVGVNEFNQEFFDKIDEIENDILNGVSINTLSEKFDLNLKSINQYKYSSKSNSIEKKIFELRNNEYDIIEDKENFIVYKIDNIIEKKPDLNDTETKDEILQLVMQKNKFDYNKKLLDKIREKKMNDINFEELGKDNIQSITLNSIKDNKKFEINSVKILYSLPINSFTLISDEKGKIYLAKIKKYNNPKFDKDSKDYISFATKENTKIRDGILKSYDIFLNKKYNVEINQLALNNVKNIFQ
tara:strand:+ start:2165 stop:3583 length:1419 start_codon:yes stop_codon:yes gene_type:complete